MRRYEIKLAPYVIDKICNIRKWYLTIDLLVFVISVIAIIYAAFNTEWGEGTVAILGLELYLFAQGSFGRLLHLLFANRQCRECIWEIGSFHEHRRHFYTWDDLSPKPQEVIWDYDSLLLIMKDMALTRRKHFKQRGVIDYEEESSDPFIDPILRIFYEEEEIQKWRTARLKWMKENGK